MSESPEWYAKFRADLKLRIGKHGHICLGTETEGGRPFTYTIGLAKPYGHELILFAVPYKHATPILNAAAETMKAGPLPLNVKLPSRSMDPASINDWVNVATMLKECDHPDLFELYAVQARQYWGRDVRVVQMLVPDKAGLFPGEEGCNRVIEQMQPKLYRS